MANGSWTGCIYVADFYVRLISRILGAMNHDWNSLLRSARGESTNTTVTGTDSSILSARIAYFYNLLGPAITLNTACSSSMVAFHMAAPALKNGRYLKVVK